MKDSKEINSELKKICKDVRVSVKHGGCMRGVYVKVKTEEDKEKVRAHCWEHLDDDVTSFIFSVEE